MSRTGCSWSHKHILPLIAWAQPATVGHMSTCYRWSHKHNRLQLITWAHATVDRISITGYSWSHEHTLQLITWAHATADRMSTRYRWSHSTKGYRRCAACSTAHNTTVTNYSARISLYAGRNKTANSELRAVVHRHHSDAPYFNNITQFHGAARVNRI